MHGPQRACKPQADLLCWMQTGLKLRYPLKRLSPYPARKGRGTRAHILQAADPRKAAESKLSSCSQTSVER